MNIKKLTVAAVLTVTALALSYAEQFLPVYLPLPGIKLGLANIVTVFALYELKTRDAVMITIARCVLAALLFGGITQMIFSLTGGFFAVAAMALLRRSKHLTVYGVSSGGACMHNIGQVLAAITVMGEPKLVSYLLILLPVSLVTGTGVALVYGVSARYFHKITKSSQIYK